MGLGVQVVVVRMCCELTEGKRETIRHWAKQLRGIDLWVLFDYKVGGRW